MADKSGQALIRGIDIDKLAKGFADEAIIMKNFCTVSPTSAREIRWIQKTSGFLDTTDTTGMTSSRIDNVAQLALPETVEQSWTRQTSYVKKYFVESPWISEEDIRDSDPDLLATNIRDLVRAVSHRVDTRVWDVMTESRGGLTGLTINSVTTSGSWTTGGGGCNIVTDFEAAKEAIRTDGYDASNAVVLLNPINNKRMMIWFISQLGSSVPQFASGAVGSQRITSVLGLRCVVSTAVTANYAAVVVPNRAVTWKSFMPITSAVKTEEGIGRKIRVWEEGEALLTDPEAVCLISGTGTT